MKRVDGESGNKACAEQLMGGDILPPKQKTNNNYNKKHSILICQKHPTLYHARYKVRCTTNSWKNG